MGARNRTGRERIRRELKTFNNQLFEIPVELGRCKSLVTRA